LKVCGIFRDVRGIASVRCFAITIALRTKGIRIAPGAVITSGTIGPNPVLVIRTGVEVIHVDPVFVADSGEVIPGAAGITPLYAVAIGSVTGSPGPGAGVLCDIIGIAPFGCITWVFH
jgi:hypothetical protein